MSAKTVLQSLKNNSNCIIKWNIIKKFQLIVIVSNIKTVPIFIDKFNPRKVFIELFGDTYILWFC